MPQSIAIAVTPGNPSSLRRVTVDVPEPGPTEVLIDVIRCGICGTDQEVIGGHVGGAPEDDGFIILGHEMLGRISKTGGGVSGLSPGDLVTATVRRPDGCPLCQAGQPDMCLWDGYTEHGIERLHGFLSQHVVIDQEWVVRLPEDLEPTGHFVEPLTVVAKALRQVGHIQQRLAIWKPETAIVLGAGAIGIFSTMILRSMGVDVYTVARTREPNRSASAIEQTGAHYVSTRDESLDGLLDRIPPVDVVVESTGAAPMSHEAIRLIGKNGVVALLSLTGHSGEVTVPADVLNHRLVHGNGVVIGSINAGRQDWDAAVGYLGRFEQLWPGLTASVVTDRIPFDADISAIAKDPGGETIKTVIEFT